MAQDNALASTYSGKQNRLGNVVLMRITPPSLNAHPNMMFRACKPVRSGVRKGWNICKSARTIRPACLLAILREQVLVYKQSHEHLSHMSADSIHTHTCHPRAYPCILVGKQSHKRQSHTPVACNTRTLFLVLNHAFQKGHQRI